MSTSHTPEYTPDTLVMSTCTVHAGTACVISTRGSRVGSEKPWISQYQMMFSF